jgi:DNA-binding transcriptional LysR family regulator
MKAQLSDIDWTNLHTFLEVARGGSATRASEKLRVDVTTVRRRLSALEDSLGLMLFVKSGRSLQLSGDGERIFAIVAQMDELSRAISRDATDASRDLVGVVRVSTMEGFGSYFLAPRLSEFVQRHPRLSIQLVASQTILNLAEREADVSLNMVRPQRGRLIVRRAGYFGVGLYGSPAYLEQAGVPSVLADLRTHEFVTYVDELISVPHVRWLPDVIADPKTRFACTSLVAQYEAAVEGAGLAMLPTFMVRRRAGLVRVMPSEINLVRDWWLVVHADLQNVPRIRAVINFITEAMRRDQAILTSDTS